MPVFVTTLTILLILTFKQAPRSIKKNIPTGSQAKEGISWITR